MLLYDMNGVDEGNSEYKLFRGLFPNEVLCSLC